jgi:hypothetical protein
MAMWQMTRHFSGSPPAGSLFPAGVAPHACMRVIARDFICHFSHHGASPGRSIVAVTIRTIAATGQREGREMGSGE